jgi:hypothetical protein
MYKNPKIELPYDPEIPLVGICPKYLKSACQRDTCTPMFTETLFITAKL